MQVKEIISALEEWAPPNYAEDFDNVGLLVGERDREVSGILVTLDTLENVVEEAIDNQCNLIVSFHPIVFKGLKSLTGRTYVERVVMKALRNNIAIYALHTALDNLLEGVNDKMCEVLGLKNRKILIPKPLTIRKLTTYVPIKHATEVRDALFQAGAGAIGNYSQCSFSTPGKGTFNGNEHSNPTVGKRGELKTEEEMQLQVTFSKHLEQKVLQALFANHPYEEVAYELIHLENTNRDIGIGMVGDLDEGMHEKAFLAWIKKIFNTGSVRHSPLRKNTIKKVAVLGGSGAFAIGAAKRAGADVLITADLKYHDFYKAEGSILLGDIGHYESEQYTKNLICAFLTKKFPNFAIVLSQKNTNPIQYS